MYKFALFAIFATASAILNVANARGQGGGRPAGGRPGSGLRGPPGIFTIVDLNNHCEADLVFEGCPESGSGETPLAWVCREGFDRETGEKKHFSTCVHQPLGHSTDSCGCCGGEDTSCPQPCKCSCDDGEGVFVIEQDGDDAGEERCMDPMRAFRKVTRSDRYSCKPEAECLSI
jgi:hypothetical protein